MKSGIYRLKFDSEKTYIGKSLNIEERIKQHMSAFRDGNAARKMQAEYDKYGAPSYQVLAVVHADHIDLAETFFISYYKPELNTVIGTPLSYADFELLIDVFDMSTVDIVRQWNSDKQEWYNDVLKLQEISSKYDNQLWNTEAAQKLKTMQVVNAELSKKITAYEKLPWYKRLFLKPAK